MTKIELQGASTQTFGFTLEPGQVSAFEEVIKKSTERLLAEKVIGALLTVERGIVRVSMGSSGNPNAAGHTLPEQTALQFHGWPSMLGVKLLGVSGEQAQVAVTFFIRR